MRHKKRGIRLEIRTRLVNYMKELGDKDLCVAFSGGVDSSVILRAACEAAAANGKKVYAVTLRQNCTRRRLAAGSESGQRSRRYSSCYLCQ